MKVINLEEAKANLEQYAAECQSSPVVVTVEGKPAFEMLPIRSEDPDFVDRLLDQNEAFRQLLEERHRESASGKVSSLETVRERLKAAPK
jgi:antitoxin (DNA-binding transcriptional repressor) of toxin-antitoxin stability system